MDIINNFFTFLTDRNYRVSHKATMVFSIIILLILADNIIGFSYYYNNQNKIEQVDKLSTLLKNPSLDENCKKELEKLRFDILHHKSIKDVTYNLLSNISFDQDIKKPSSKVPTKEANVIREVKRNFYWHFISSSWIWLILMVGLPFAALTDRSQPLGQNLGILIVVEFILWFFAWLQAKVFSLIPIINNTPLINYSINFLITVIFIFVIYRMRKKA